MIGHGHGLGLIVGDEQRGRVDLAQHVAHLLAEFDAELGVEGAERLVEQDEPGRGRKRASQGHALLLPAGELVRAPVAEALEPDELEQFRDPGLALVTGLVDDPKGDIPRDAQVREQRALLGHDPDAAVVRGHGRRRRRVKLAPSERDRAGVGCLEPGDAAQKRRLAGTGRPENRHEVPGRREQVDPVEGDRLVTSGGVGLMKSTHAQHSTTVAAGREAPEGC